MKSNKRTDEKLALIFQLIFFMKFLAFECICDQLFASIGYPPEILFQDFFIGSVFSQGKSKWNMQLY